MIFVVVKRKGKAWKRERIFARTPEGVQQLQAYVMELYGKKGVEGVDITNPDGSEFRF